MTDKISLHLMGPAHPSESSEWRSGMLLHLQVIANCMKCTGGWWLVSSRQQGCCYCWWWWWWLCCTQFWIFRWTAWWHYSGLVLVWTDCREGQRYESTLENVTLANARLNIRRYFLTFWQLVFFLDFLVAWPFEKLMRYNSRQLNWFRTADDKAKCVFISRKYG